MHGNVEEWVQDYWEGDYEGAPTDGSAVPSPYKGATFHVVRGGSWAYKPQSLRSADRSLSTAGTRTAIRGFRVAQDL